MIRTAVLRKVLAEEGLIKTARETTWDDVVDALQKADRAARRLGPEAEAAVDAWADLDEDHSDRDFYRVQMAISEALDPLYEDGQDRMAEKLMRPWRVLLDFRSDRKLRRKGGKILPVGIGDVEAVGITPRGEWFIDAIMRNTYRSPERWLYALVNEWQVPSRMANKLHDELKGR